VSSFDNEKLRPSSHEKSSEAAWTLGRGNFALSEKKKKKKKKKKKGKRQPKKKKTKKRKATKPI